MGRIYSYFKSDKKFHRNLRSAILLHSVMIFKNRQLESIYELVEE